MANSYSGPWQWHHNGQAGSRHQYYCVPPTGFRNTHHSASPRYTSNGEYATAVFYDSTPQQIHIHRRTSARQRRTSSHTNENHQRPNLQMRSKKHHVKGTSYYDDAPAGYPTDYHYNTQDGYFFQDRDTAYESRPHRTVNTDQPATARPASSHANIKPTVAPKATEADVKKHRISAGYSLKNWDPSEEPILLLGSVFDANSLGKWIYDWTAYHHGPSTPISEMAGEMWLLLIQLARKIKKADLCVNLVWSIEKREIIEVFIELGERLTEKLRKLLGACEQPMLKAKKKDSKLGKNAGIEFVKTLFGQERELENTERFMQGVRMFILRFDTNCEEILQNPTQ